MALQIGILNVVLMAGGGLVALFGAVGVLLPGVVGLGLQKALAVGRAKVGRTPVGRDPGDPGTVERPDAYRYLFVFVGAVGFALALLGLAV